MARWDGTLWNRAQFTEKLNSVTLPNWVRAVAFHCVAAPTMKQARETPYNQGGKMRVGPDMDKAFAQRQRNFLGRINSDLKGVGWHVTIFENGKIGEGEPLTKQSHAHNSWNDEALAIEMCFDGNSSDPLTEGGRVILDTAAWWAAQILKKLNLPA